MQRVVRWIGMLFGLLSAMGLAARAAPSKAKYYVEIGTAEAAPGLASELSGETQRILEQEIRKRPEFVLDPTLAADPAGLEKALEQRGLKGLKMSVRLTEAGQRILPPAEGHRYQQLEVKVRAAIVAATLPGDQMALSGEGESATRSEISGPPKQTEVRELARDALADALSQAINKCAQKLAANQPTRRHKRK